MLFTLGHNVASSWSPVLLYAAGLGVLLVGVVIGVAIFRRRGHRAIAQRLTALGGRLGVEQPDDKGKVENWTMELSTPLMLMRTGWTRTTLKPGDAVTVTFYPSKNGAGLGYLDTLVLADGTVLFRGGSTHIGEQGVAQ